MKPGRRDRRYKILITGRELAELKRFARSMVEAFGLDRQIDNYKGTRPIGFYAQKRTLRIDKRTAATGQGYQMVPIANHSSDNHVWMPARRRGLARGPAGR